MGVKVEELQPNIRDFIAGQLKPGEILLTNAPIRTDDLPKARTNIVRGNRILLSETTAEDLALKLERSPKYERVRTVMYPSSILPGVQAVIVKPVTS